MAKKTIPTEYLIAEFNAIQNRAINLENLRSSRVNFLLFTTGAIIAGIGGLVQTDILLPYIKTIVLLAAGSILTIGLLTLNYTIDDTVTLVLFWRYAARIRRYFVDESPVMEKYLPFPPYDDKPRVDSSHLALRGSDATLLVINSLAACVALFFFLGKVPMYTASIISICVFPVLLALQLLFMRLRFNYEERSIKNMAIYASPQK